MKILSTPVQIWLYSNLFLRNLLTDLFSRGRQQTYLTDSKRLFSFQIGSYRNDFHLYFSKTPTYTQYKNEIFNKLNEYSGSEVTDYLEFHYERAGEKKDFIDFLLAELPARIPQFSRKRSRNNLRLALDWATSRRDKIARPENHVPLLTQNLQASNTQTSIDFLVEYILKSGLLGSVIEKLQTHTDQIMTATETGVRNIMTSIGTGSIILNNRNHDEKLIQILLLLQQVQAPAHVSRVEQVFTRFTAADIASILHLHFESFRDNKLNTIQRKVGDQLERLKPNHPKVMKLSEAFQDFFYS